MIEETVEKDLMPTTDGSASTPSGRTALVALAVCCAVPMLGIVLLTVVLGVALGPAVAVWLGVVAAGVCAAVMVQHARRGARDRTEHHRDG